jgi:hypothetical protein
MQPPGSRNWQLISLSFKIIFSVLMNSSLALTWAKAHLHWLGLYAKMPVITCQYCLPYLSWQKPCLHWQRLCNNAGDSDSHYLLALATLGDATQIGLFLFLVVSPKVAKASTVMTVKCCCRQRFCFANFANVNNSLGSFLFGSRCPRWPRQVR